MRISPFSQAISIAQTKQKELIFASPRLHTVKRRECNIVRGAHKFKINVPFCINVASFTGKKYRNSKRSVQDPATFKWASPVLFVSNHGGSFWFCIDYRCLNEFLVKLKYL